MQEQKNQDLQVVTVPKEAAVFWMDKDGFWNNDGGRFELKKIIRRFNASISRDAAGYYVTQINGKRREKVYFFHEDTALFAIDIQKKPPGSMRLNTGKRIPFLPEKIYKTEENLYTVHQGEWIKFSERSLLKLVPLIDMETDPWILHWERRTYVVSDRPISSFSGAPVPGPRHS